MTTILRNPVYAGHVWHRGEIVAREVHPALVTDEEQRRAVDALQRRKGIRRKDGTTSWADGFVYHACGRRMYLTAWRRDARGAVRFRYRCNAQFDRKRRGDHACHVGGGSVFASEIEVTFVRLLVDALSTVATPAQARARIEARHDATARERERARTRLAKRLDDLTRQRDRLLDMTLAGRVDDEMYVMRDATLKGEIAAVRAELDAVPVEVPVQALEAHHALLVDLADAVPVVAHSAPERLPGLLHQMDARLVVGPGATEIRFGEMTAAFLG